MAYSKEVTAIILADWAKGASAEETRRHLQDVYGKAPCLNTIYAHRKRLTTDDLVDELMRQQLRDITTAQNPRTKMHYRNELLKLLLPLKIEQLTVNRNEQYREQVIKYVVELVDPADSANRAEASDSLQVS